MSLKRKHLLPLILFLLVLFALVSKQKNSTLGKKDRDLSFTNSSKANNIEIVTANNSFILLKEDEIWYTNDRNEANPKTIHQLFKVLENIQILSPVIKENQKEFREHLEKSGTGIKIFSDKKLLYELKFSMLDNKNYALTEAGNLFFISLRAYGNANLGMFTKSKVSEWYDKVLINLEPKEITSILLDFTEKPQAGFRISNENHKSQLFNKNDIIEEKASSESINDYLHFFSGIQYALIDTVLQIPNPNKQMFRLNINTNIDKTIHIVGFELVDKKTLIPDKSEFVGIVNNSLMVKLSYSDFDPILVDRDYFLKN